MEKVTYTDFFAGMVRLGIQGVKSYLDDDSPSFLHYILLEPQCIAGALSHVVFEVRNGMFYVHRVIAVAHGILVGEYLLVTLIIQCRYSSVSLISAESEVGVIAKTEVTELDVQLMPARSNIQSNWQ